MLAARIIKPATSPWGLPVVIAKKKDGSPRFCVDYRALNKRLKADKFLLPKIEEVIDDMAGSKIFSKLDMFAGYWQIKLAESVREKTTFRCKFGSFQFEVMPFGLMNAPSTFQRMTESLFKDLDFVRVYIDDVVIGFRSIKEHTNHLIVVCDRIRESGLKIKLKKCVFAASRVEVLGYIVLENGVEPDPEKIRCISEARLPQSKKEL